MMCPWAAQVPPLVRRRFYGFRSARTNKQTNKKPRGSWTPRRLRGWLVDPTFFGVLLPISAKKNGTREPSVISFFREARSSILAAWVAARGAQAYRERRSLGTHASVAVLVIMYRTYVVLKSKQKKSELRQGATGSMSRRCRGMSGVGIGGFPPTSVTRLLFRLPPP